MFANNAKGKALLPRSRFVTLLAWAMIVVGGLLLPISVVSCTMLMVGSDGTQSATLGGIFTVVVLPWLTVAGGIGLMRRQRWAYGFTVALLLFLMAWNVWQDFTAPEPGVYYSPSGAKTTITAAETTFTVPIVIGCLALLALLLQRRIRAEFGLAPVAAGAAFGRGNTSAAAGVTAPATGETNGRTGPALLGRLFRRQGGDHGEANWRVGHQGRDNMYYEERHGGGWRRIDISGEMLTERAHHIIYFASPERWREYPEWARDRRAQIVARIKSRFQPPDYEYYDDGETFAPRLTTPAGRDTLASAGASSVRQAPAQTQGSAPARAPARAAAGKSYWKVYAVVLSVLFGTTAFTGWLVIDGIRSGETRMFAKPPTPRRIVSRAEDPGQFWISLSIYGAIGLGTAGLALWGIAQVRGSNRN